MLRNSIVADNTATNFGPDIKGTITSSYNVVKTVDFLLNGYGGTNDQNLDPQLGSFQDNGGPGKTFRPSAFSPAVGNGLAGAVVIDGRGAARSNPPDSGAVEIGSTPLVTVTLAGTAIPPAQNLTVATGVTIDSLDFRVTAHEDTGEALSVTVTIDTPFTGFSAAEWGHGTNSVSPPLTFVPGSGIFDATGTHTVTITVTDASANFTVWTGTITVNPAVVVEAVITVGGGGGGSSGGCTAGTTGRSVGLAGYLVLMVLVLTAGLIRRRCSPRWS